jgi:hypothetical protein
LRLFIFSNKSVRRELTRNATLWTLFRNTIIIEGQ